MVDNKNTPVSTEQKIMEAAIKVFTTKGLAGARMQDIADEAEVNKAMVHYYFRNKQQLFEKVFEGKLKELFSAFEIILQSDKSFEEKIREFVITDITLLSKIPKMPLFVINEVGKKSAILDKLFKEGGPKMLKGIFKNMVETEVKAGNIKSIDYQQLMINLLAMCIYPFVAQPIIQAVLDIDDNQFDDLIEARKTQVADLILNDILLKK